MERDGLKEVVQLSGISDVVLQQIRSFAQKYQIERILLFGSRARGDFHRTSDIDLAISGGDFANFSIDVDELTDTLLKYDFVNLDGAVQEELSEKPVKPLVLTTPLKKSYYYTICSIFPVKTILYFVYKITFSVASF